MKKVRWGLIGAGNIAHAFAHDILFTDNAELVAVASRDEDNAKQFATSYGVKTAYKGYDALYADNTVDAIYIATPHNFHVEQSLAALASGKAVLCEKPLATTPDETRSFIEQAEQYPHFAMEAMWTYFLPAIQTAKRWVDEGRIGKIQHIKADFGFKMDYEPEKRLYKPELAGGCILDMGIYPIAIAWLFTQSQPIAQQALGRFAPSGVEDDVLTLCDYGHISASLSSSFRTKLKNYACIIGSEGYISLPDFWSAKSCELYRVDKQLNPYGDTLVERFDDKRTTVGFQFEIQAASQDILDGKTRSDIMPLETSLAFQEHMAALKQSIKP